MRFSRISLIFKCLKFESFNFFSTISVRKRTIFSWEMLRRKWKKYYRHLSHSLFFMLFFSFLSVFICFAWRLFHSWTLARQVCHWSYVPQAGLEHGLSLVAIPAQSLPPFWGRGLVQVLLSVTTPVPQVTLHSPNVENGDQPPATGWATGWTTTGAEKYCLKLIYISVEIRSVFNYAEGLLPEFGRY